MPFKPCSDYSFQLYISKETSFRKIWRRNSSMATKVLLSENLKYHLLCKQDTLVKPCGNQRFSHPIKCQLLPVSEESRRLNYGCDLGPTHQITKSRTKKNLWKIFAPPKQCKFFGKWRQNYGNELSSFFMVWRIKLIQSVSSKKFLGHK